ncbi:MAG: hypothetical protein Q7S61_04990 [bacterium]|nr:hypothetical protein [bacterium]
MTHKPGLLPSIFTVSALLFLAIFSLSSTALLSQKQTTSSQASSNNLCRDNPAVPPDGYFWKANCVLSCTKNEDCPKNDTDARVNPDTSNWCYPFEESRCLRLEYVETNSPTISMTPTPTESGIFPTSTRSPTPTTVVSTPTPSPELTVSKAEPLRASLTPTTKPVVPTQTEQSKVTLEQNMLYIENVSSNKLIRVTGLELGNNVVRISEVLMPKRSYAYSFSNICGLFSNGGEASVAYYSSDDAFQTLKIKQIRLDCNKTEVMGIE